jgi:antitoxin CptB
MTETRENRIKRMHMRAMRRGMKEMDIILQAYAEANLPKMSDAELDLFDQLLSEYDPDLYQWLTGQKEGPEELRALIHDVSQTFQK